MNINWADTPGVYYAIAYAISLCMMVQNSPRRWEKKKSMPALIGFGIFLCIFMTVMHGITQWLFIPFMLLIIMLMWAMVRILCTYDVLTSMYFTIRAFIIGEFIASFEFQLFYYAITYAHIPLTWLVNIIFIILIDGILIGIFYNLEKRNKDVNINLIINRNELLSVILIAIAIYTVSNLSYIFEGFRISDIVINQLYTVRTLVDMGGMAILYAYHMKLGELNMRLEAQRLSDMLEMQHNNYEMLRQSIDAINQKYHDLKYQISVLKSETDTKQSLEYLEQMEKEIKAYEAQNKTGNKTLDTILTAKSLYCQNNWIELTSVADGQALDFMEPMDISILFGNMLDNAIESVSQIEKKERRLIHLAIARQKGFLRIRMENCYDKEPKLENGVLVTSKDDRQYHGFGIKSIQNTVKKYGGSTTISAQNGWFELRILIPVK